MSDVLYTIGHSTHSAEELAALLKTHGVAQLVDVRSIPKSRHCPQFNAEAMTEWMPAAGLLYVPMKVLGGRRSTRKTSVNIGWRNASFRGYADYMGTAEFAAGLQELMRLGRERVTAIMCAEAVPWRCHRSLIADALVVRDWEVREIISAAPAKAHKLTSFLQVMDGVMTYPAEEGAQGELDLGE